MPIAYQQQHAVVKCVVLHNDNQFASVALAHSTTLTAKFKAVKHVLEKIHYNEHQWVIYVDLMMANVIWERRTTVWVHQIPMPSVPMTKSGLGRSN